MKERLWKNVWVVLYVVLMGVLAIATFLEHAYGTTFVQTHIYHACWFCGLWVRWLSACAGMWQMPAVEAPPGLVVAWLSFSDTGRGHAYLPDR